MSPAAMAEESFAKFRKDLGVVLGCIKYAQDKEGLVSDGVLTLKDAAARAGIALEEFRKRAALL